MVDQRPSPRFRDINTEIRTRLAKEQQFAVVHSNSRGQHTSLKKTQSATRSFGARHPRRMRQYNAMEKQERQYKQQLEPQRADKPLLSLQEASLPLDSTGPLPRPNSPRPTPLHPHPWKGVGADVANAARCTAVGGHPGASAAACRSLPVHV